ncbi:putative inactive patatin-like protein 9 [Cardamine amara subsp. amara]|uniref:Inactive patatin-like protein 9 n=1 Tax=Cardamine amara subsp. amara TaxID=228776 RepID=A0ABD1AUX6_CARAN
MGRNFTLIWDQLISSSTLDFAQAKSGERFQQRVLDCKVLTMKDTCKPLLVPCYDLKSKPLCRATSATPSLFKPFNVVSVDGKTSCSGGLVMNNPTAAAVTHVLHNKRDFPSVNGVDDLLVLSLGNGSSSFPGKKLRRNGDCSTSCVVNIVLTGVSDTDYV